MKDFFKPENFYKLAEAADAHEIANEVNAQLNKLIESWPVVYGHWAKGGTPAYWGPSEENRFKDTHTARLAFIEEIKREPCKHEPNTYEATSGWSGGLYGKVPEIIKATNGFMYSKTCRHCGVELQATWSEKK